MRLPRRPPDRSTGANMTPMIDVVFLLIIFFLVSSHLARRESRLPLELPLAATSDPQPDAASRLTVSISRDGQWSIGGREVDEAELTQVLRRHRDQHGPAAQVRIRTDRRVAYGRLEPVLRSAAAAGLWNPAIAVYREDR